MKELKKEFKDQLIKFGAYEKWLANYEKFGEENTIEELNKMETFEFFILVSFVWAKTTEGQEYWCDISKSNEGVSKPYSILKYILAGIVILGLLTGFILFLI